jgi:hypothetical protein
VHPAEGLERLGATRAWHVDLIPGHGVASPEAEGHQTSTGSLKPPIERVTGPAASPWAANLSPPER